MIDNFSILLSHALLAIALWRLMNRVDLDVEDPPVPDERPPGFAIKSRVKRQQEDTSPHA
ncbi:MAG: hypothetical protein V4657_12270 [Pseudomonadota bacterium]